MKSWGLRAGLLITGWNVRCSSDLSGMPTDFSIYCQTKSKARHAGNQVYIYLRDKLKLPINREKSGIRRPVHLQVLGYGFVPVYQCRKIYLLRGYSSFRKPFRNKLYKANLSNAASSAIQNDPELRLYYDRKAEEGEGSMG